MDCFFKGVCKLEDTDYCTKCRYSWIGYLASVTLAKKTGIPKRCRTGSIYDLSNIPVEVLKYYENTEASVESGEGLYMYSKTAGNGKTTSGCQILRRFFGIDLTKDQDITVQRILYLNVSEYLARIRKSFSFPDEDLANLQSDLCSIDCAPKLLLLDDIGAERGTDFAIQELYNLINFRYSNELATLYTSNLSIKELGSKIGVRISSRIEGSTTVAKFTEKDRRHNNG